MDPPQPIFQATVASRLTILLVEAVRSGQYYPAEETLV